MNSSWLKAQFDINPEKNKAALAKALGIAPAAISKILNDTRRIKADEYIGMREFFGLPNDGERALKNNLGTYTISTLKKNSALDENTQADPDWVIPAGILKSRTPAPPEKIKIFQIKEHVMEPDFRQGEHVLVDLSDTVPSPPGPFIIFDGFGYMVRQCDFIAGSNPPKIKISTKDPYFAPQTAELETINLTGRIIAKMQML